MNRELFKKIDDMITLTPTRLDMESWENQPADRTECGTTRCIAGWAVYETTGQPLYVIDDDGLVRQHPSLTTLAERLGTAISGKGTEFQEVNISALAVKLLDLPRSHRALFYSEDDIAAAYVKAVAEGRDDDAARLLDLA